MRGFLLVLALAAGCYEDRYRCTSDAQCNIGEGGRCEIDNFCTKYDEACATGRRYQHAGELGDACFEDAVIPQNPCAGGQPPARAEDCFADVCRRLPACCTTAWTDACVQLAQVTCSNLRCDTRIAITARQGIINELWDLRWNGGGWEIPKRQDAFAAPLQWVAPSPGKSLPRLAATTGNNALVIGIGDGPDELRFPTEPGSTHTSITSINFDRDRRDTIVLGYVGSDLMPRVGILKPHDDSVRTSAVQPSAWITWGDLDHDTFPDAVMRTAVLAPQYHYVPSLDGDRHVRALATGDTNVSTQGGPTDSSPQLRNIDWIDLDGDTRLDLIAAGNDLRIHLAPIGDTPALRVDCDPPKSDLSCTSDPEPNLRAMSFGAAARPTREGNELIVTTHPKRRLYRGTLAGGTLQLAPLPLFPPTCECPKRNCATLSGDTCTASDCVCEYQCDACLPIVAVIVRDLDGDHALDLIAIDARLKLYHSFAGTGFTEWHGPLVIPTQLGNVEGFVTIQTSVSGATF
ncbi:MAG: hypothetical protein M4D80_33210 [Myxococcota bacterium]|nr:hypothetical protein [Deltaproteobacteria bacterium]MDQ3340044.1 hypothetical protein [Myxococcota bacterium]